MASRQRRDEIKSVAAGEATTVHTSLFVVLSPEAGEAIRKEI
jgi:hypothetical protein